MRFGRRPDAWSEVNHAHGEPIMSGWQRIGVVLSVLWIVGYPIYSFIDENESNERAYRTCQKTAFELTGPILANENFWILGVAAPLAIFWILGGLTLWSARWIRRGFARLGKP